MTDTDLILREIGELKSNMQEGFGVINTNAAILAGKVDALGGEHGRVTRIEKDMERQALWTKIHSLAIFILPPGIHQALKAFGIVK